MASKEYSVKDNISQSIDAASTSKEGKEKVSQILEQLKSFEIEYELMLKKSEILRTSSATLEFGIETSLYQLKRIVEKNCFKKNVH
jgi:hypothetical protein